MAAKTPVTDTTASGYVDPERGYFGGVVAAADNLRTGTNENRLDRLGLKFSIFFFDNIDDADTWTSNTPNIRAVAFQPADANDDDVRAHLTIQATGVVTFQTGGNDREGWLWVIRGS